MKQRLLYKFLLENQKEILELTEEKSLELAGVHKSSPQLKKGLPIFYRQLVTVLQVEGENSVSEKDKEGMAKAAHESDEPAMALASGKPEEVEIAKSAGLHGLELLRLGYTLSHVVHAYGAMCQSITELAVTKNVGITAGEFHDLNRCLDIAIAGAVTEFQTQRNSQTASYEMEHLGALAHELRNALTSATVSLQLIERGTVGFSGSTGLVLKKSIKRMEELIDRSLTEVRLRIDPKVHAESGYLIQLVDEIAATAEVEARSRNQSLDIQIDPTLVFEADHQLLHSALSNLIQNALKYTHTGGKVQVRGSLVGEQIIIEVEDECAGLLSDNTEDLFRPYEQQNKNRKGVGLGLAIAQRAVVLNQGSIEARNLPGKGCIFKITLPRKMGRLKMASVA